MVIRDQAGAESASVRCWNHRSSSDSTSLELHVVLDQPEHPPDQQAYPPDEP
ncbi:hypothetical protein Tco_0847184, partial [Tanacetum coccineum]